MENKAKVQVVEFWYGEYGSNERPCVYFRIKGEIHSKYIEMIDKEFSHLLKKSITNYLDYGWKVEWIKK